MVLNGPVVHVVSEQVDLSLHLPPQLVVVQVAAFLVAATSDPILGSVICDREDGGDEGFLEIGEAEVLGDACDGGTQFSGEVDHFLVYALFAPWMVSESAVPLSRLLWSVSGAGKGFRSCTIDERGTMD